MQKHRDAAWRSLTSPDEIRVSSALETSKRASTAGRGRSISLTQSDRFTWPPKSKGACMGGPFCFEQEAQIEQIEQIEQLFASPNPSEVYPGYP